jgi:hypothetical protein
MPETDLHQPGRSPLFEAAEAAQLTQAASGHGPHLADRDSLVPLASGTRTGYEPGATAGMDRAIRVSTAIAVLAVAGVAAYVSYLARLCCRACAW